MPLALIARLLTRALLVVGVVFLRRRARPGTAPPPPYRTPGVDGSGAPQGLFRTLAARTWLGRQVPEMKEGARMAGFALSFAAFGVAALVLLSAGTTLVTLGPRWVGWVILALAAMFGVAAIREAVWLRRAVNLRRRRRWAQHLPEPAAPKPQDR